MYRKKSARDESPVSIKTKPNQSNKQTTTKKNQHCLSFLPVWKVNMMCRTTTTNRKDIHKNGVLNDSISYISSGLPTSRLLVIGEKPTAVLNTPTTRFYITS